LVENPAKFIAIHCTHGVNRTGYFIISVILHYCVCGARV
jgi:hypothetical protein